MVRCNVTVTTADGVTSYSGLFANTVRAARDAVQRFGLATKVRVERA